MADTHLIKSLRGTQGKADIKDAITQRGVWSDLPADAAWGGHGTHTLTRTIMVRMSASKPPVPMYQDIIFN